MTERGLALCIVSSLCVFAVYGSAATLTGSTSKPNYSVFIKREPVTLTFTAEQLQPNQTGLSVLVTISDADGQVLMKKELPVTADANGKWIGTLAALSDLLGYCHVTARLSSGEELPAVGSRGAGFLSYMVVIDPKERVAPGEDAHFGMQGGFTTAFDARPYLGIRWVLGGYGWGREEPDRAGQFAEKRRQLREQPDTQAQALRDADRELGILPLPTLLVGTPKWAVTDGKLVYTTGVLKDLVAWRNYCREVGRAAREDYPHLKHHVYQITWEPVYPWGFPGTDEDLIRSYQSAYPALHEADPTAVVIGPTGGGISVGDLQWNERLLKLGLGKYLDGLSIHPYIAQPPETHNLVGNIRALKEMIRTYVGHDLDIYGTEQGWPTGGDPAKERPQAMWLTRTYLITLGEGFKANVAFYFADYPGEPGYGFFHNLNLKIPFGTNSVSPKPMAAAFAAMTMLLEGHKSAGPIEWLGPTALGYAYQRESKVTLALWDYGAAPRTVKLPVGVDAVEVFDWMGNPRTVPTPGGTLQITLGPTPQYVRGVSPALWGLGAKRPLVLESANLKVFPGDTTKLVAKVSATANKPVAASLRFEFPEGLGIPTINKTLSLKAGQQASIPLELTVPGDADFGAFPIKCTLSRKDEILGFATAMLRVREPFAVEKLQATSARGLEVTVHNRRTVATRCLMDVRLRGAPDARQELGFDTKPSDTTVFSVNFGEADLDPTRVYQAETNITDKNGLVVQSHFPVAFTTAPGMARSPNIDGNLGEWENVAVMSLKGREFVVRQPQLYRGAKDLSAEVRYAWDSTALYLCADVTDDIFLQSKEGFDTWHEDCLQAAFDIQPGKVASGTGNVLAEAGQRTNTEIDLALTKKGPEAYRTMTLDEKKLPVALIDRKDLALAVTKREGGATYEAAIPWRTLGFDKPPQPNSVIGIALTVNDADAPKQLDPKAIGLFGGITPTKNPAKFGQLVLVGEGVKTDSSGTAEGAPAAAKVSGFLGQSESPQSPPAPWTGCVGAMADSAGWLWTIAGDRAYCFADLKLQKAVSLPTGMRAMRGDGKRMVCLGQDDKLYALDVETEKVQFVADARFPDGKGPRDIALSPAGELFALGHDGSVRGWKSDGTSQDELFRLTPGKDWWYCSLGVDPKTGDFLVGSYYPDNKVYRCNATGKLLATHECDSGHAAMLTTFDGEAWMLNVGGRAAPVMKASSQRHVVSGDWAYYPTGIAADGKGGSWIACAQGLLRFDRKGNPTGQRIGGMADPGLIVAGPDGTVLTLLENGQRIARMYADDLPDSSFASVANEPWRVGNGWAGHAVGLCWDGTGYLVLDTTAKCLYRFDPDHTAWGEKPWTRLTKEGVLQNPRALAVGDALAFVLDGDKLLSLCIPDPEQPSSTLPLPASVKSSDVVALAASDDDHLYLATQTRVVAFDRQGREAWANSEGCTQIVALAASSGRVFLADRGAKRVAVLNAENGKARTSLPGNDVPGGLEPTGIAVQGKWVFVSDIGGKRVVRLKWR